MSHLDYKEAFADLQSQVFKGIENHFPVDGRFQRLELESLDVDDRGLRSDDIRAQKQAKLDGTTWSAPVYGTLVLKDKETGKVLQRKKLKMADLPLVTRRYSHIVDGQEYQVTSQWQLKPGVYTKRRQSGELETRFNVPNKQSFDITFDPEKQVFHMDRGKSKKIPVYPLMKSLGVTDAELEAKWGRDVLEANKAARGSKGALAKFYKADRKKPPGTQEEAENYFIDTMTQSSLRPDSTEVTLGKGFDSIDGDTFARATTKMLGVQQGDIPEDDRDSLVFKDLRSTGDFAYDKLTNWQTSRSIKNKMLRKINGARTIRDVVKYDTFNEPVRQTFSKNDALAEVAAQVNPVEMVAASMKTTVMGPGGIQSGRAVTDEQKLINPSHLGYLDPIHTPESEKTGVTLHLPLAVKKVGREAQIPVYNVKTGKMEHVGPRKFLSANVVMPDQVEWEKNKPKPVGPTVQMASSGNEITKGKFKDADYVMMHPSQMFSVTSNLIPFMGNNSGNRASYATHHIEQAISLKEREAPLVQVGTGAKKGGLRTFEEFLGRNTGHAAPVDGTVSRVEKDAIFVKGRDGKEREVQIYDNFPLNDMKSVMHSTPTVKPGDSVKAGQSIADTNFTKGGKLALGTNLNVAYLPYKGYNFEDGVVISESAAKKLSSEHMHKPVMKIDRDTVTDPKKFAVQHTEAFNKDQYKTLDSKGVVRVGTKVQTGDPLILGTKPYELRDRMGVGAIRKSASGAHTDVSMRWESDHPGEVVGVHKNKKGEVTVHVRTVEPMQVGDKLTGRHGNKGIVTKVLPDAEMPRTKGGDHVEVALNPAGVPGRMNVGQVLETVAGKIAKKTGKPYVVDNFSKDADVLERVKGELKQHGLSDTEELVDPVTGKSLGKALMGPQHMLKLTHQIDKKLSVRSGMNISGAPPESYDNNLMPSGGGKTGGQSMGNLGMNVMLAHGAKANIREMQTWKSEGPDTSPDTKMWKSQHIDVWNAIQNGEPLPPPKSTFAFQKFTDMLRAAGVNVEKEGNRMRLAPLTDKQVLDMSHGEVKKPSALTYPTIDKKTGEPKPIRGGLFDPKTTGGHNGMKWTHFKLAEPMPNPLFEGAARQVLGLTQKQYNAVIEGDKAIDRKTGSLVDMDTAGSIAGGAGIVHLLNQVDVKKELKKAHSELDKVKADPVKLAHGKSTAKLDTAYKKVKYLTALDDLGMSAKDAYTMQHVPVLPPKMRPASVLPNGNVRWADLNGLYKDLGALNEQMSSPSQQYLDDTSKKGNRAALYDGLKALVGVGHSKADREGKNKGVVMQLAGASPKQGYFQKTLLSRRQDMSMRSTIVPEPAMGLDQVGLPTEKAMTLFRPFLVKKMVDIGAAEHSLDAMKQLEQKGSHKNRQVQKALDLVMEERPILLKRDPALHKHSVQAFNAFRAPGKAIQIHPLVTSGYNADFDGDTMSAYVPISTEAVTEAKKMYPSSNLFNEATGRVTHTPTLESALGLYKLSRVTGDSKKRFKNPADALQAVEAGKVGMTDAVQVQGVGKTTAGRLLLSSALPQPMQKKVLTDHNFTLTTKNIEKVYTDIAKNHRGEFGQAANRLKDLGFDAAYGAVRVPNPNAQGPDAIKAAEDLKKNVRILPMPTHTLSLDDFTPDKALRDKIVQQTQRRVDMIDRSHPAKTKRDKETRDQLVVEEWTKATNQLTQQHQQRAAKRDDNLFQMLQAGVKPKPDQYQQVKLAPMLVEDASGRTLPTPVTRSYAEGLDVAGYWTQMSGARKGTVKKVQEVRDPGYFSKQLINTTMNLVVNGDDCGTRRGVGMSVMSDDIYDRELAADVKARGQTFTAGTILTPDIVSQIRRADKKAQLAVRSPLKCEHGRGLCQKCAGLSPDGTLYAKGTNLGVLSAQSLGERSVQLSLKAFHSGGVAGAGGKTLGMFGRIKQLTELPEKIPDAATLAMSSGTVEKIEKGRLGTNVTISGKQHFVPLDRAGRPLTEGVAGMKQLGGIKWTPPKVGQKVAAGTTLSDPNRTFVNMHDLYRSTGSMEKVQNHLVNELHGLYKDEGVRRQHLETVVKGMSNLTRVRDPGDAMGVLKGEYQPHSVIAARNRQLVQQGKRPVKHTPILKGIDMMPLAVQEDWMAKMNHNRLNETVVKAAATGGISDLHGLHPIPGMAYGAEFGMTEKHQRLKPHLKGVPKFGY